MYDIDTDILPSLAIPLMTREADRNDAAIMLARTRAHDRGATPVEIQRNMHAYEGSK